MSVAFTNGELGWSEVNLDRVQVWLRNGRWEG